MDAPRRLTAAIAVAAIAIAAAGLAHGRSQPPASATTRLGTPVRAITLALRAAGLRFAPSVAPADRAWILAAVADARPEARRLVDAVDGLVEVDTETSGERLPGGYEAVGVTYPGPDGFRVVLDTGLLDGRARFSRDVVVLHELGHVIDFTLVPRDLAERLDRTIPDSGPCVSADQRTGACTAPEERFADTFAKWALRGAVSAAGAGYGVDAPLLDEWALPLAGLAA